MTDTRTRARVPAGTRHGGRFVATRNSETLLTLAGREPGSPAVPQSPDRVGSADPISLPDGAVLHPRIAFDRNRDGSYESVWCGRCGADIEDYDQQAAIDAGADPCDEPDVH